MYKLLIVLMAWLLKQAMKMRDPSQPEKSAERVLSNVLRKLGFEQMVIALSFDPDTRFWLDEDPGWVVRRNSEYAVPKFGAVIAVGRPSALSPEDEELLATLMEAPEQEIDLT